jgi:hypothetical protein
MMLDEGEGKVTPSDQDGQRSEQPHSGPPHNLTAATKSAERALRLARMSLVLAVLALLFGIIAALIR